MNSLVRAHFLLESPLMGKPTAVVLGKVARGGEILFEPNGEVLVGKLPDLGQAPTLFSGVAAEIDGVSVPCGFPYRFPSLVDGNTEMGRRRSHLSPNEHLNSFVLCGGVTFDGVDGGQWKVWRIRTVCGHGRGRRHAVLDLSENPLTEDGN